MEEIDIIELLRLVKEGNAPKEIEIKGTQYSLTGHGLIKYKYNDNGNFWFSSDNIYLDTKIKILDKPKIKEFTTLINCDDTRSLANGLADITIKLNEIIRFINKENKE